MTKSPIEELFLRHLEAYCEYSHTPIMVGNKMGPFPDCPYIAVHPQYRIGTYAVDFLVSLVIPSVGGCSQFVIECDGHAYHNSPYQVAYDRRRDGWMQLQGYKVLRYTGREITRRPHEVIIQVLTALSMTTLQELSRRLDSSDERVQKLLEGMASMARNRMASECGNILLKAEVSQYN